MVDPETASPAPDASIVSHAFIMRPVQLLITAGISPGLVAARAGLDPRAAQDHSALLSYTAGLRFFEEAARALDDRCVGLSMAMDNSLRNYGLNGFLIANNPTLMLGLLDLEKHVERLIASVGIRVHPRGELTDLALRVDARGPGRDFVVQDVLAGIAQRGPEATGVHWTPVSVRLRQEEIEPDRFLAAFGVMPVFGAEDDVVTFRTSDLLRPIPTADPIVLAHMREAVETQVRKRKAAAQRSVNLLNLHGFVVDLASGSVRHPDGTRESLTSKERELLAFFATRANTVVSHESIERDLWGIGKNVLSYAPAVAIRRLRKKIEADPAHPSSLVTVFGEGWKLVVPAS